MAQEVNHPRLKYLISYTLAMAAAFLTFRSFYLFQGSSKFGIQTVGLNLVILLFLWFLSFIHSSFIKRNLFLVIVLPLSGLQIANLMLLITTPGTSLLGYLSFVLTSSVLIFVSYTARKYERQF